MQLRADRSAFSRRWRKSTRCDTKNDQASGDGIAARRPQLFHDFKICDRCDRPQQLAISLRHEVTRIEEPMNVPGGQKAVSQAAAHSAKSAMRGNLSKLWTISLIFRLVRLIVPGIVYDNAGTREMSHIAGYED